MSILKHKNIILLYGICIEPANLCLVMELMTQNLYLKLNSHEVLPWNLRIKIALDIVNGLFYLHEVQNVIHRDLKSSNVLLDENNVAKITDFGLSKVKMETSLVST